MRRGLMAFWRLYVFARSLSSAMYIQVDSYRGTHPGGALQYSAPLPSSPLRCHHQRQAPSSAHRPPPASTSAKLHPAAAPVRPPTRTSPSITLHYVCHFIAIATCHLRIDRLPFACV
ncbi:uncharacterized protein BKA78DRAFT_320977 [Phyllosticta capitalensis]|uniref:uncharacterized protein n=1 Tax=Phyllosticta capitalensis TaxID=121624 RepID=UPI003131B9CA